MAIHDFEHLTNSNIAGSDYKLSPKLSRFSFGDTMTSRMTTSDSLVLFVVAILIGCAATGVQPAIASASTDPGSSQNNTPPKPLAVIMTAPLDYFNMPENDSNSAAAGQFDVDESACATGKTYTSAINRIPYFQFVLSNGQIVYTPVGTETFSLDQEGEPDCISSVAKINLNSTAGVIYAETHNSKPPPEAQPAEHAQNDAQSPSTSVPAITSAAAAETSQDNSPQSGGHLAVIAEGPIPYYWRSSNINHGQPVGQFLPNEHLCSEWYRTFPDGSGVISIALPGVGVVEASYTPQNFAIDPMHTCYLKIPASVSDPQMRADIEEVDNYYAANGWDTNLSTSYPSNDPGVTESTTKLTIADYFLNKTDFLNAGDPPPKDEDVAKWNDDKTAYQTVGDITEARRWYQLILNQDASGANSNNAENGVRSCNDMLSAYKDRFALDTKIKAYQNAAATGDVKAGDALADALGDQYDEGQAVPQDYGQAMDWYRKAALQGDPVAEDDMAKLYYNGYGVTADDGQAMGWYRKAAAQGNTDAQSQLTVVARDEEDQKNHTGPYAPAPPVYSVCCRSRMIPYSAFFGHNNYDDDDGD